LPTVYFGNTRIARPKSTILVYSVLRMLNAELQAEKITDTLIVLHRRIENRFPGSGLGETCTDLIAFSRQTPLVTAQIVKPNWWLRLGIGIFLLISKIGFLYIADFDDPDANQSVNELEGLTTGLSRKIWQKIAILNSRKTSEVMG
jgi:hypothetical protein